MVSHCVTALFVRLRQSYIALNHDDVNDMRRVVDRMGGTMKKTYEDNGDSAGHGALHDRDFVIGDEQDRLEGQEG